LLKIENNTENLQPKLGQGILTTGNLQPKLGQGILTTGNLHPILGQGILTRENLHPILGHDFTDHVKSTPYFWGKEIRLLEISSKFWD